MIIKKSIFAFLAGMLGILSFSPFSYKYLIFFSYAYLIYLLIESKSFKFREVFLWGIGHWGFGMSWIIVSIYYYGETHIITSFLIYIILTIILSLVFTSPLLITTYINNKIKFNNTFLKTITISSFLMMSEISRDYLLYGVPWLTPGNIYLDTISQNIYPIFGASFASLIIYVLCAMLVIYNQKKSALFICTALILLSIYPEKAKNEKGIIPISIIQPSSDPFRKYNADYSINLENNIINQLKKITSSSELVILPEAELPYPTNNPRFKKFIQKTEITNKLVIGAWLLEKNQLYNSIYVPSNGDYYKKIHLVPFGEYIPFIESLRSIISFFDLPMSNVSSGPHNQENLIINNYKIATPICFDIAFSKTVRKMNKSSDFIINISNDTWFGNSIGPHHHLNIARVRAIENNKWIIRATNDGFSAIISNKGTIVDKIDKGVTGILEGNINPITDRSFYNEYGFILSSLFSFIFVLLSLLSVLWNSIKRI